MRHRRLERRKVERLGDCSVARRERVGCRGLGNERLPAHVVGDIERRNLQAEVDHPRQRRHRRRRVRATELVADTNLNGCRVGLIGRPTNHFGPRVEHVEGQPDQHRLLDDGVLRHPHQITRRQVEQLTRRQQPLRERVHPPVPTRIGHPRHHRTRRTTRVHLDQQRRVGHPPVALHEIVERMRHRRLEHSGGHRSRTGDWGFGDQHARHHKCHQGRKRRRQHCRPSPSEATHVIHDTPFRSSPVAFPQPNTAIGAPEEDDDSFAGRTGVVQWR